MKFNFRSQRNEYFYFRIRLNARCSDSEFSYE